MTRKLMSKAELKRRREAWVKAIRAKERFAVYIAERAVHGFQLDAKQAEIYRDLETTEIACALAHGTAVTRYAQQSIEFADAWREARNELRSGAGL